LGPYLRQAAKLILNYRGQRPEIIRRWVFDLMRRFSPSIAVERNGIRYYVNTADKEVGRTVFALGRFEDDMMMRAIDILESKCGRSRILEGSTFIDVGANIGTSTITAMKVLGAERAVAIEPAPDNFALLQCNLIINQLASRVHAVPVALSDRAGKAMLELSETNSGDHRIQQVGASVPSTRQRSMVDVPTVRFDDLVADLRIDLGGVGLVWMDAQGHEGHILAGADSLLQSRVPVVLEYWPCQLKAASGLSTLHEVVAKNYDLVVDLRASILGTRPAEYAAKSIAELEDVYRDSGELTDILLIKESVEDLPALQGGPAG
jgi:FkbM family methyltransferase